MLAIIHLLLFEPHNSEGLFNDDSLEVSHCLLPEVDFVQPRKFGEELLHYLLNLLVELLLLRRSM